MSSSSSSSSDEDDVREDPRQVAETFFGDDYTEDTWVLRRRDVKPRHRHQRKRQKAFTSGNMPFSLLTEAEVLSVSHFLDPPDLVSWFQVSKFLWQCSKLNTVWSIRLQSIFSYFRILKKEADRIAAINGCDWKELIRLLSFVAIQMQRVYGDEYEVHLLHRTLYVEDLLRRLFPHQLGNDVDEDDEQELVFCWNLTSRRSSLIITSIFRFDWVIALGDEYHAFVLNDYHKEEFDVSMRTDVLNRNGVVWVHFYQDEDNYKIVGLRRKAHHGADHVTLVGAPDRFKSLAHYHVLGHRRTPFDNSSRPSRASIAYRILWMYHRRIPPFHSENCVDWEELSSFTRERLQGDGSDAIDGWTIAGASGYAIV